MNTHQSLLLFVSCAAWKTFKHFLFINTYRTRQRNKHVFSPPHVVVYRRKALITGYVHSNTSCSPARTLPVISWPGLIKRLHLFLQLQSWRQIKLWMAHSLLGGTGDEFLTQSLGYCCSGSTNKLQRVNTAFLRCWGLHLLKQDAAGGDTPCPAGWSWLMKMLLSWSWIC